jgi:hypothetical protein
LEISPVCAIRFIQGFTDVAKAIRFVFIGQQVANSIPLLKRGQKAEAQKIQVPATGIFF